VITCVACGEKPAAKVIGYCPDCLRSLPDTSPVKLPHSRVRKRFGLPDLPPQNPKGKLCPLCANACRIGSGETGYCGLRQNINGRLKTIFPNHSALVHAYLDPLPTNCCAAWFCEGTKEEGYNLAVFFYGCNLNCLFCQNSSHKTLSGAPVLSEEDLIQAALSPNVRCVCFFGGSPEPQFPFALKVGQKIIDASHNTKHICWEWNGCGNSALVRKAAELSEMSGGTVKFDLKAFHPQIASALCGTNLTRSYENFLMLARQFPRQNLLTSTTLLVPYYVDQREVDEIAHFISEENKDLPYSLLVFHPDFEMNDLPLTPRSQVEECYRAASRHLSRVHIGNKPLLFGS